MKHINNISSSLLSGILIGMAGTAFIATKEINIILASFLFSFALIFIIILKLNLYTGKIGYVFEIKDPIFFIECLIFNLLGAFLVGLFVSLTNPTLKEIAINTVNPKLNKSLIRYLIDGILCGAIIYLIVEACKRVESPCAKILLTSIGIMIFILSGFEHSIADMFYFSAASIYSWESLLFIVVVIIGNSIGSIIFYFLIKLASIKKKEA